MTTTFTQELHVLSEDRIYKCDTDIYGNVSNQQIIESAGVTSDKIIGLSKFLIPIAGVLERRINQDYLILLSGKYLFQLFEDIPTTLYDLVLNMVETAFESTEDFTFSKLVQEYGREDYTKYHLYMNSNLSGLAASFSYRYILTYDSHNIPIYSYLSAFVFLDGRVLFIFDRKDALAGFDNAFLRSWDKMTQVVSYTTIDGNLLEALFRANYTDFDYYEETPYGSTLVGFLYLALPYIITSPRYNSYYTVTGISSTETLVPSPSFRAYYGGQF
jgi:hypothetical protein